MGGLSKRGQQSMLGGEAVVENNWYDTDVAIRPGGGRGLRPAPAGGGQHGCIWRTEDVMLVKHGSNIGGDEQSTPIA